MNTGEGSTRALRVIVESWDGDRLRARDEEHPDGAPLEVACNVAGVNAEFNPTITRLWQGCCLNLLRVTTREDGLLLPGIIILEPDYLVDISSLSECVKEHGIHPAYYLLARLSPRENTPALLLGNAANLFLDALLGERPGEPVSYPATLEKLFRSSPLDFATCPGIDPAFFREMEAQFGHLRRVLDVALPARGIQRDRGLIEPSFMCRQLGLQGRLDFLQLEGESPAVIELKSGKPPFPGNNYSLVSPNHQAQASLYQIVIQHVLGPSLPTYILYSKSTAPGSNLRPIYPSPAETRQVLDLRNQIVATEREIAADPSGEKSRYHLERARPENLISNRQNESFLQRYIIPRLTAFHDPLDDASPLEKAYFHAFHAFLTREHFLAKTGSPGNNPDRKGAAAAWRSPAAEKLQRGDMLLDLRVERDDSTIEESPSITFRLPPRDNSCCPSNFREGDIVMLHERADERDNVPTRQVFRGFIQ